MVNHLDSAGLGCCSEGRSECVGVECTPEEHFGRRNRRCQVVDLVSPVDRKVEVGVGRVDAVDVDDPPADGDGCVGNGEPVSTAVPLCVCLFDTRRDGSLGGRRKRAGYDGRGVVDDRGLLAGDLADRLAEEVDVVECNPCDHGNGGVYDAGGIPAAPHADLHDRYIEGDPCKDGESESSRDLEVGDPAPRSAFVFLDEPCNIGDRLGEFLRGDRGSVDLEALFDTVQMGRGEGTGANPMRPEDVCDQARHGGLAVRPCNVDHGVVQVRISHEADQSGDPLEPRFHSLADPFVQEPFGVLAVSMFGIG